MHTPSIFFHTLNHFLSFNSLLFLINIYNIFSVFHNNYPLHKYSIIHRNPPLLLYKILYLDIFLKISLIHIYIFHVLIQNFPFLFLIFKYNNLLLLNMIKFLNKLLRDQPKFLRIQHDFFQTIYLLLLKPFNIPLWLIRIISYLYKLLSDFPAKWHNIYGLHLKFFSLSILFYYILPRLIQTLPYL